MGLWERADQGYDDHSKVVDMFFLRGARDKCSCVVEQNNNLLQSNIAIWSPKA